MVDEGTPMPTGEPQLELSESEFRLLGIVSASLFNPEVTDEFKDDLTRLSVTERTALLGTPLKLLGIDITDPNQLRQVHGALDQLAKYLGSDKNFPMRFTPKPR